MVNLLGSIAEFEREMIVERVKSGLANAKHKGKKLGKPTKVPIEVQRQAFTLKEQGMSYSQVAQATGLKIPAIQRIIKRLTV
jgi:DNA invertase Pin-like site-specific DNA recombinase